MRNERLEGLRGRLRRYREAEDAILTAQSYEVDGMRLTRADLGKVQRMIAELEGEISRLERDSVDRHRSRMRVVIPVDGMRYRP